MPRVPWEQRRDKLSGALWVIPVLFMAGAIAVGGLLSACGTRRSPVVLLLFTLWDLAGRVSPRR